MLNCMAETEIIERCRLSTGRINWLVERFRGDLDRDTNRRHRGNTFFGGET